MRDALATTAVSRRHTKPTPARWIALCALLVACGGTPAPADRPASIAGADGDGAPVRAWISRDIGPCPWIIELFPDGSLETNHLSDDRGNRCLFHRLPYALDRTREPPLLTAAGQLSRCLFDRDGERLRLSCEDHGEPDPARAEWLVFEPFEVREESTLANLVGTWTTPAFFGSPSEMRITAAGEMKASDDPGAGIEVVEPGRLVLTLAENQERCLFRVTAHRFTLRCQPAADGWPSSLFEPDAPSESETTTFARF